MTETTSTPVLHETSPSSPRLPSVTETFKMAWETMKKSALNLLLLSAINFGITFLLAIGLVLVFVLGGASSQILDPGSSQELFNSPFLWGLIAASMIIFVAMIIISMIFQAAMIFVVGKVEEKPTISEAISVGRKVIWPLFLTGIISGLITFGGTMAFIVPGIIMSIFFMFASYEVVFEHKSALEALKSSAGIVKHNFWELLGRSILYGILYFILFGIIPSFFEESTNAVVQGFMMLWSLFGSVISSWYSIAFSIVLYQQAKAITSAEQRSQPLATWIWVFAGLGWLIFILVFGAIAKVLSTQGDVIMNQLQEELRQPPTPSLRDIEDEMELNLETSSLNSLDQAYSNLDQANDASSILAKQEFSNEAIKHLEVAIQAEPENVEALAVLASVCIDEDYPQTKCSSEDALQYAKQAQALDSTDPRLSNLLGDIYNQQHEYDKALIEYQRALRLDANSIDAHLGMGYSYIGKNNSSAANEHLQTVIDLARDSELLSPTEKAEYTSQAITLLTSI